MNLQQYAGLAASILFFKQEAAAQIIYTDVPDTTIGFDDGEFSVDLNNDGITDVIIKAERTDTYHTNGAWYTHIVNRSLYAIPKMGNGILGGFGAAVALQSNILIDGNSPWAANGQFRMATYQFVVHSYGEGGLYYYNTNYYGPWYPNVGDRYLGVRFKDGSEVFYGWIRLFVEIPYFLVTLKDYAYEATPDSGIYSAQDYPTQIAIASLEGVFIHSSPGQSIEINLNSPDLMGGKVTVTNLLGEPVAIFDADNLITKRSLNNVSSGWYNVSVYKGGKQFNKSVMLY